MEVIFGDDSVKFDKKSTAVGLGNFDGLHVGHMALVNALIDEARLNGLKSVIYTFTVHPENIIRKKLITPLLTSVSKKVEILSRTALDYLFFDKFDETYSRMDPETFVRQILMEKLGAKIVVAGFNYRFGYMGQGDAELLKKFGEKMGFKVVIISPIKIDRQTVSSTLIREYISKGNMEKVHALLGRHFSITGEVLPGKRLGRKIGFPTANLQPERYLIMPRPGVYLTKTLFNGKIYNSLTNIGYNPTFGGEKRISAETHIIDFDKDIYASNIEVFFLKKLRDEKKFKNAAELTEQIKRDIQQAKEYFGI